MPKTIHRTLATVACLTSLSIAGTGTAIAQPQSKSVTTSMSVEQARVSMESLSIDASSGKYMFDEFGAVHAGLTPTEARQSANLFESLTPQEVAEVNIDIAAPIAGATSQRINTYSGDKAHCDRQYAKDSAKCRRVPTAQLKAACWAAAAARYANCRR